jgi:hypothetical protein
MNGAQRAFFARIVCKGLTRAVERRLAPYAQLGENFAGNFNISQRAGRDPTYVVGTERESRTSQ